MASVNSSKTPDPDQDPDDAADAHESAIQPPDEIPVEYGDVDDLGNTPDTEEALRRKTNLEQRLNEQKLLSYFVAVDFSGPLYLDFQTELIRYGLSVMRAWLYSGYVFKLLNDLRMPLHPTAWELERLQRDPDARGGIANMVIAMALPKFEDHALRRGGWGPDGGASLPTFFMGKALYEVPNQFRRWRREMRGSSRTDLHDTPPSEWSRLGLDPAVHTIDDETLHECLDALTDNQRASILLTVAGHDQDEIAEILQLRSARAVEGLVRRARARLDQHRKLQREGGQ